MQGRSENQRDLLDAESVVGHLVKPGSVFAFLAEHRKVLFPDAMFTDLFPSPRGRPSVPADVIASVIVLQTLHGLSDSETTDALTFDLRWKAAVGWPLTSKAFHDTTLTVWRKRLLASADPNRIFTAVGQLIEQTGALKGKTRRALDSTVLDDAVATQDTVTQLIAAVRRVRRLVPDAAQVVAKVTSAHDYDDPGKPTIAWDDKDARDALIDALVRDALAVLAALPEQNAGPAADAVGLLALVAGQDVELIEPDPEGEDSDGGDIGAAPRWRIAQRVAPDRVISVVDPDARHAHKSVGVLDGDELKLGGQELGASVRDVVQPPEQEQVRQTLATFVGPLGRMLLLSSGLLLALEGELDAPPAPGDAPAAQPVTPDEPAPSQWDAPAPALYGAIRAALDTPLINTIWRQLAGAGQLEHAWSALEPQVSSSRPAADALQQRAVEAACDLPWTVVASRDALDAAGIGDAAPGMAAVLDAYVKTLPRLLVLASSSARDQS